MSVPSDQGQSINEIIEPVNRYFHNPIAASIVNILKDTWVTPDQTTYISIFIGLFAIAAGRLADQWSSPGMLIIMFLGMGSAIVFCCFSDTQNILMIFQGFLGIFAAIYHPVGILWTIKTSKKSLKCA